MNPLYCSTCHVAIGARRFRSCVGHHTESSLDQDGERRCQDCARQARREARPACCVLCCDPIADGPYRACEACAVSARAAILAGGLSRLEAALGASCINSRAVLIGICGQTEVPKC